MSKISVVIPTYNRAEYICEAIESVLNQTYQDLEIIVVDDGSVDDTKQMIKGYLSRINYIYQENSGVSSARNTGIVESKGDYIAFLDSDDLWSPNKLKLQINFMDSNPSFGMVYADACGFKDDKIIHSSFLELKKFTSYGYIFGNLIKEDFILTPTVLVRREVFSDIGMFDSSLSVAEDYDMWLRIAEKYQIGLINECLAKYRRHDTNISSRKSYIYPDMEIKIFERYRNSDNALIKKIIKNRLAESYFYRGYINLNQGNNKLALRDFLYSLRCGFFSSKIIFLLPLALINPDIANKIRNARRRLLTLFKKAS